MYNRYVPQSDGSYRRQKCQEAVTQTRRENKPHRQSKDNQPTECPPPCPPQIMPEPPCQDHSHTKKIVRQDTCRHSDGSVTNFLQNLLPKDFDTGDLLIILLLLLMSGDCAEDQNTALLTLALYCFM